VKKIGVYLEATPHYGGMFQYDLAILEAVASLPRENFAIIIAYTDPVWLEYLKPYNLSSVMVQKVGVLVKILGKLWNITKLPMSWWRKITQYFHPVAKTLVPQKCDLWIFPSQDKWSYQVDVPALGTIHDLMHRYERRFPEVADENEYAYRERLYSNMCAMTRGVLVDSEVGRQQVHESYGTPLDHIYVLPFVPPTYVYEKKVPDGFDTRYNLPRKFIFYPAQFWEHKNHVRLIDAINRLRNDLSDIHLVLVGSKKNGYDKARQLVETLKLEDHVSFLGYVPNEDMPELYRRARAMVMPTFFGPTNIPQLEAFVLECPVATSNVYGIPEQVGDAALLFNPDSVEEIADSIYRLWTSDELCEELAKKGKQQVAKWEQKEFNQKLAGIIEQVV